MKIPLNQIKPNPQQPRKHFDQASINELAQSIIQIGLIQPIVITKNGSGYYLVDGERRWRACQTIPGMTEIEVVITEQAGTDLDKILQSLVANIQREDLSLIDEATACHKLQSEFDLSIARIALLTGKSMPTIKSRLMIMELDPEIQILMDEKSLPHADEVIEALQSLPAEIRIKTARKLANQGLTIRGHLKAIQNVREHTSKEKFDFDDFDFDAPSLKLSLRKTKTYDKRAWGMLQQLGKLPKWEFVRESAKSTCDACSLRDSASQAVCRECPAVEMIRLLMEKTADGS